jgi:peptide/nickel transport system substrate-binding protein
MDELELRILVARVRQGALSRRGFIRILAGVGLSLPIAGQILMHAGAAHAASGRRMAYAPARRGGGGVLKLLMWQGPTLLNPHFAVGVKDIYGCRLFYQALADWDNDGNLIPVLAADVPTLENGGVARDGRSVTWSLKSNVQWHDGRPFTADDVMFNGEYGADPATATVTIGVYKDVRVEKLGTHKVRVHYAKPTPFWADPFVGSRGMMVPKHLFEGFKGARSREAPANLSPVGTGPYRFVEFLPGDLVRGALHAGYHEPNRPHFDAVEMKGGGDAVSAARAVLQTGEFDYAWNIQVEDEILRRLEQGGKGRVVILPTGSIEHIQLNAADPWSEVEGERSSAKSRHPVFSDRAVREALSLLVDRESVQKHIYGRTAAVSANFLNLPERFRSPNQQWEFSVEKANRLLDAAGWKPGSDGIRARDGRKLKLVFTTSINAPRQKTQAIVKQACRKAGIDLELKSVTASVYFSADAGNPDTSGRFTADMQMYNWTMGQPDPAYFMNMFCTSEIASKANKWIGRNSSRWRSDEFDALFSAAESELDPVKRAAMFIRMNDLAVESRYIIPIVTRAQVIAVGRNVQAQFSAWTSDTFLLQDWYKTPRPA